MRADFPRAPLAQVLRQDTIYITELEPRLYPKLSVKLYGRGVVMDAPTDGSTVKMSRHQLARPGQVILSEIWAKKGAIGIVPPEGQNALVTSHFFLFDIDESQLLPRFMYWLLCGNYFADELDAQAHGTTGYAAIRPNQFLSLEIPLPPVAGQQRIVARIEALARRVEEARGLRQEAVEAADVIFYSASRELRQQLCSTHPTKPIGDITTVTSGGTPDRSNPSYWEDGTIPWIKTGELVDAPIIDSEEKITDEAVANSSARLYPINTVLIALYGQGQTRGRTGLLKIQATTNQACAAILPDPMIFESVYLQYWLRSLYHEMRQENRAGAQPNWNGGMIKRIAVALPPLAEQRRVVAYLDGLHAKVDKLRRLQAETQKELDAMMPSILAKAFAGEL